MRKGKLVQNRPKFNPFTKQLMMNSGGFPDYIILRRQTCANCIAHNFGECGFDVRFIECKINGTLSKEEKEKIDWIKKELKIPVAIASKGEKRGDIKYEQK